MRHITFVVWTNPDNSNFVYRQTVETANQGFSRKSFAWDSGGTSAECASIEAPQTPRK